jgi:PAS domain S-box-containing protein
MPRDPAAVRAAFPDEEDPMQSLAEIDERCRKLAESMPQLVWMTDHHGKLEWVNHHWLEYIGSTIEESRASGWAGVFHPDDAAAMRASWRLAVHAGKPYEREVRIRRRSDGVYRWFLIRGTPQRREDGELIGWVGTGTDIEDIRRADARSRADAEHMQQRDEQLRLALAAGHIGTWEYRPRSGELETDARCKALFGMPEDQPITYEMLIQAIHPDDRERMQQAVRQTLDDIDGAAYDIEYRVFGIGDGVLRWVSVKGRAFRGADGQAECLVGTMTDRTDIKRDAEHDHLLAEAGTVLVGSFDLHAMLRDIARLCVTRISDWCAIDLVDQGGALERVAIEHRDPTKVALARELHRRYPPTPESPSMRVLATGVSYLVEKLGDATIELGAQDAEHVRLIKSLGLRSAIMVALRASDRTLGVLILVTAESRRALTHRDLAFAEDLGGRIGVAIENARLFAAERASRALAVEKAEGLARANGELEQLAYVCSHDLQEPLRMVTQYVDLLRRAHYDTLPERSRRHLDYVSEAAARMQALIRDILTYGRIGGAPAQPEPVELDRVVDEALGNLQVAIQQAGAQVVREALPRITGTKIQLVQLFQNLIGNALKFRRPDVPAEVRLAARRLDGGWWEIAIQDNGIGIDPAHWGKIFEVFQRLHLRSEYAGNGIGLSICKKIVERHGGRIWVESAPGTGSIFRFTLPGAEPGAGRG